MILLHTICVANGDINAYELHNCDCFLLNDDDNNKLLLRRHVKGQLLIIGDVQTRSNRIKERCMYRININAGLPGTQHEVISAGSTNKDLVNL